MKKKDILLFTNKFKEVSDKIDHNLLNEKKFELKIGFWLDSVVFRLQKKAWTNNKNASIFFSIWLNEEGIKANKLLYNIHALKLREFKGYSIQSRDFAFAFREKFKKYKAKWPNVSIDYGPLTLMEGFQKIDLSDFEKEMLVLIDLFFKMEHLIDDNLKERKIVVDKKSKAI
ncbi:MAG: hypothetical protein JNJ41_07400 [Bacteroidia bacterium]|nr:hypothetical protein [Bacteroidia bacterium]